MGNGKEIDSEATRQAAEQINERLKESPSDKALKHAQKVIARDYLPRMLKYEGQEEILKNRRSYSKTDTEATFMRMKEDHMRKGQLKPGYNVQIGMENQFVTGYSTYQRPGDTSCMKAHLKELKNRMGKLPKVIIADAGYGSEEDYEYMKDKELEVYLKYNTYHKEKSREWHKDILLIQNWYYVEERDEYICGNGRYLMFRYEKVVQSENGYQSFEHIYECENCDDCPYRSKFVKNADEKDDRRIYINPRLNEHKREARDKGEQRNRQANAQPKTH